jgi:hypothetical protein
MKKTNVHVSGLDWGSGPCNGHKWAESVVYLLFLYNKARVSSRPKPCLARAKSSRADRPKSRPTAHPRRPKSSYKIKKKVCGQNRPLPSCRTDHAPEILLQRKKSKKKGQAIDSNPSAWTQAVGAFVFRRSSKI